MKTTVPKAGGKGVGHMGISKNSGHDRRIARYMDIYIYIRMFPKIYSGTPKSSILMGVSIINHPFWGTLIFGNTHIVP